MNNYINLKNNGILFPIWVLKNFKKYKLDKIIINKNDDVCSNMENKLELTKYQAFLSSYLNYNSIYKNILIFHGLGSGKTITTINLYNILYNYNPNWNIIVLLKASLKKSWISDFDKYFTDESEKENKIKNFYFISYDAPNSNEIFIDVIKKLNVSNKTMYIIDESHNFISNVYTNVIHKKGFKAKIIYDHILQHKIDDNTVRIILLSATPIINKPFELSLIFNLLRNNIFPKNENDFNSHFIYKGKINENTKNSFQRRILGLVSYYKSNNPEYFASHDIYIEYCDMSEYQYKIYKYFSVLENKIGETYKTYTRQSSNFVFPYMQQKYSGETRPRISEIRKNHKEDYEEIYLDKLNKFIFYFKNLLKSNYSNEFINDIEEFKKSNNIDIFLKIHKKSKLFQILCDCSIKMIKIIKNIFKSEGPVIVYSNYVRCEGIEIFKIYLEYFGFTNYNKNNEFNHIKNKKYTYLEYHGDIDDKTRQKNLDIFNKKENVNGNIIKVFLLSSAGSEGISLLSIKQIHIMEPYWQETRIIQVIGRGIRLCSHRYLDKDKRHVDVYKYLSIYNNEKNHFTTDKIIHDMAKQKQITIDHFLDILKESAVDCELNKNHNMYIEKYNCFNFEQNLFFKTEKIPAYKEDIIDDLNMNNGTNNPTSYLKTIKIIKIKAVYLKDNNYSNEENFWYDPKNRIVYDYNMQYPIGKVLLDENGMPVKTEKNQYIISVIIDIPLI